MLYFESVIKQNTGKGGNSSADASTRKRHTIAPVKGSENMYIIRLWKGEGRAEAMGTQQHPQLCSPPSPAPLSPLTQNPITDRAVTTHYR